MTPRHHQKKPPRVAQRAFGAFLGFVGGALLVVQGGVNTNLRRSALRSPWLTALFSFSVGLLFVSSLACLHRPCLGRRLPCCRRGLDSDEPTSLRACLAVAPWYCYMGGVLGPVYVVAAVLLTRRLGFSTYQLCATTGMLSASLVCDAVGLLGLTRRKPSSPKLLATAALLVAAGLVAYGRGGGTASSSSSSSSSSQGGNTATYWLSCAVGVAAGCCFPVQACVNRSMTLHVRTPLRASVVSFTGGVVVVRLRLSRNSRALKSIYPS